MKSLKERQAERAQRAHDNAEETSASAESVQYDRQNAQAIAQGQIDNQTVPVKRKDAEEAGIKTVKGSAATSPFKSGA